MFNDHLSSYRLPARWQVRTQLPAGSQSVRVKCPNMTLSDPTPVFLEAGKNRNFLSPGPSAPVDRKEGASC